ncbi:ANTAR domain-containing response regulator [Streptomyces buecherae]|uniref:ANTAR domain-containing response regulator n=2 Tax=Streptomyces buecherae TaxID=2763006 RepID=UPI00164CF54D|nr:GAF and ANTAR domain-containing protein [Streptomyces buecherae]QNJ44686.1 GAF and ANTAR domain-containing protein [Streptomyces buecherae]
MLDRTSAVPHQSLAPPPDAGVALSRELTRLAEQAVAHTPGSCGATATAVAARDVAALAGPGDPPRVPRQDMPAGRGRPPASRPPAETPESDGGPAAAGAAEAEVAEAEVEQQLTAATHPDLSALVAVQLSQGDGPIPAALHTGRPAVTDDLLYEGRWPEYRARALAAGVRASATLPFEHDGLAVTITLYGLRPGVLGPADRDTAELLGDLTVANLVCAQRYRAALAEVDQLDTALRTRPVVDQACGILMHIVGCDAQAAFDMLRRMSQRSNRKLAELAETVVRSRGRGLEPQLIEFGRTASPAPGRRARPRG